jgi:hypothetical protein
MKCDTCNKKIKLVEEILSKCKCGKHNCASHRQDHKCDYDYKSEFKNQTYTILVPVIGDKLDRI